MSSDRRPVSRRSRADRERSDLENDKKQAERNAIEAIKTALIEERFDQAEKGIGEVFRGFGRDKLPAEFLLHLGQGYSRLKKWADCERILLETREKFPSFKQIPVCITLAYISVENGRPRRAIRFLEELDQLEIEHDYAQAYTTILRAAQNLILDGCVEID